MKKKLVVFVIILLSLILLLSIFSIKNSVKVNSVQGLSKFYKAPSSSNMEIKYRIKIKKIDSNTNELLAGAEFNLTDLNGNVISTAVTDNEGCLDFGEITTYGDGIDSYYIVETQAPEGYKITEGEKIRVKVVKTVLDPENGLYTLSVNYTALDYKINTANYDFIPVSNADELSKIGSGDVFTVEGTAYEYKNNANYKLINDIDLSGINWTPINGDFEGVLDGAGYKISNLTITSSSNLNKSEIGLFSSFRGLVENLELNNVNINIKGFTNNATTETGKSGVGAFAGVMREGYIENCRVSGNITAETDNIGGFVGHTLKDGIVVVEDSDNNANVKGTKNSSNVGGIIGCSLGSVSLKNTNNTGKIEINETGRFNAGGLVGYVEPSNYKDLDLVQKCDDKVITIAVENASTEDIYNLNLEIIDKETLEHLNGAVYSVYDLDKHIIAGLDHIRLDFGFFNLFYRDIVTSGTDTYYIKENEMKKGYKALSGVIKVEVERYWDEVSNEYKVRATVNVISDKDFDGDIAKNNDSKKSSTGLIYNQGILSSTVNFARTDSNDAKAEFINCKNTGEVANSYMNAGGIVAASHGYTYIEGCENTGYVHATNENDDLSFGKAGGIISELYAWKQNVEIINCTNSGKVESTNDKEVASAAGIIACLFADASITGCENTGIVNAGKQSSASGIIAEGRGKITILSCTNSGAIKAFAGENNYDLNCNAAGIFAKNKTLFDGDSRVAMSEITFEDNIVTINNCTNTGDIRSSFNMGGILAQTDAGVVRVSNCETKNCKIYDTGVADKGGIIGVTFTTDVNISNCSVDNIELKRISDLRSQPDSTWGQNYYGSTGGIIGNMSSHRRNENSQYGSDYLTLDKLKISNCYVSNSELEVKNFDVGGILGTLDQGNAILDIEDCNISKCSLYDNGHKGTDCNVGGILGGYLYGSVHIKGCNVSETTLKADTLEGTTYGGSNVGGILGCAHSSNKVFVEDCNVLDSKIDNKGPKGSNTNSGGIIAFQYQGSYATDWVYKIDNCHVSNTDIISNESNSGGISGAAMVYSSNGNGYNVLISNCSYKNGKVHVLGAYNNNSDIAGIIGVVMGSNKIDNCIVEDADIKFENEDGRGENAAGIIGFGYNKTELNDSMVKNTNIYSTAKGSNYGSNTAGIIGGAGAQTIIKNCDTENVNITGVNSANVAGIFGGSYTGAISLEDCDVKESTIYNGRTVKDHENSGITAGIIGKGSGNGLALKNNSIMDSSVTGAGRNTAGILGVDYGDRVQLDNTVIKNVSIIENGTNDKSNDDTKSIVTRNAAGVISTCTYMLGINGLEIDNLSIESHVLSVGGVAGYVNTLKQFENVSVNNLVINNTPEVAEYNSQNPYDFTYMYGDVSGMIANLGYVSMDEDKTINNCTLTNSELNSTCHQLGGIIGTYVGTSDLEMDEITIDNVNYTNTNDVQINSGEMGGIVSYSEGNIKVKNSKFTNNEFDMIQYKNKMPRHIGGIVAYAKMGVDLDNVDFSDIKISNKTGGETGGIVGLSVENKYNSGTLEEHPITVNNSNLKDIEISGNDHVAGIVAVSNKVTVEDSDFDNIEIDGKNISGILIGMAHTRAENTVKADSINISNSVVNDPVQAAGIVGFLNSDIEANEITFENIEIESLSNAAGTIAGNIAGKLTAKNIIVNDTTIKGQAHPVGGLIGYTRGSELENITVTDTTVTTDSAIAGGIIGASDGNITAKDITVQDDVTVTGVSHTGGAIGYISGTTEIQNPIIKNVDISCTNNNTAGGVVGVINGNVNIPNVKIDNISVNAGGVCGGIIGSVNGTVTTSNSDVQNIDLTSNGQYSVLVAGYFGTASSSDITNSSLAQIKTSGNGHTGGLVAVGMVNLKDITINDIEINMPKRDSSIGVGGLVGVSNRSSNNMSIDGIDANKIVINSNGVLAGGIAGIAHCNINDVNIKNSTIIQDAPANIGGIAGILESCTLTNSIVDNVTVSGITNNGQYGDIGGAVGSSSFENDTIDNVTVKNSNITSDKEAGGIVGVANSNITNCSVDSSIITVTIPDGASRGNRGDAGGIVGASTQKVENCTVTNSTITSNKLAGGIVGAGRMGYTTLNNLTVENNTVEYGTEEEGNGNYIGAPNIYEDPEVSGLMVEEVVEEENDVEPIEESNLDVVEAQEVKDTTSEPKVDEMETSDNIKEESENIEEKTDKEIDAEEVYDPKKEISEEIFETEPKKEIEEEKTVEIETGDKPDEVVEKEEENTLEISTEIEQIVDEEPNVSNDAINE